MCYRPQKPFTKWFPCSICMPPILFKSAVNGLFNSPFCHGKTRSFCGFITNVVEANTYEVWRNQILPTVHRKCWYYLLFRIRSSGIHIWVYVYIFGMFVIFRIQGLRLTRSVVKHYQSRNYNCHPMVLGDIASFSHNAFLQCWILKYNRTCTLNFWKLSLEFSLKLL